MGTITPPAGIGWPVWIGPLSSWVAHVVWVHSLKGVVTPIIGLNFRQTQKERRATVSVIAAHS